MDYLEICELCHHGIKGQKWGVRRFQNEDGTLTEEGKRRYYDSSGKITKAGEEAMDEIIARDEKYSKQMYDLLKKYDGKYTKTDTDDNDLVGKSRNFTDDGYPLDDYVNYISDLNKYAISNGHVGASKKDAELYGKLFKERQKDMKVARYLYTTDRSKQHDFKTLGKDLLATTLFPLFGIALVADTGRAIANSKERKIYSKK